MLNPPSWAHPRSRGENSDVAVNGQTVRGSSPLTRGKHDPYVITGVRRGLIPAHAGKTANPAEWTSRQRAHPRSRGENLSLSWSRLSDRGSSPLTRGKPWTQMRAAHDTMAHPRSRGENHPAPRGPRALVGSSPLTRGKLIWPTSGPLCYGLIPAHAGKTVADAARASRWWAHPRSRGENDPGSTQPERLMGSSPLTRGKLATLAS